MASDSSATTLADIHPLVIQTQILQRLDGHSLSSVATASSFLRTVSADDTLWSDICKSTWPSITHPRVHHVISTFPSGHRSFFQDAFHPLITHIKHLNRCSLSSQPDCSLTELISAVDIRYHDKIVYSRVEFTDTTTNFMSSALNIVLKEDTTGMPERIDLKVEEVIHADDATISQLKESLTLNWVLIDPTRKRAVNLSSIKPVLAWIANGIHLRYAVVVNETVEFRIEVALTVGKGSDALHVREVRLYLQDVGCNCLSGKDFLVITGRVFLENCNITAPADKQRERLKEEDSRTRGVVGYN